MTDLVRHHQRVMAVTTAAVTAGVDAERLALPTPCGDWDLARLLAHMTGQNHGFAAVARGETRDATVFADRPVGTDPAGAFAASASEVSAAFSEDGVLDRPFWLPEIRGGITLPGRVAVGFHYIDSLVHGWDVAVTAGVPIVFDAQCLAAGLPIAGAVPDDASRETPDAAFAPGLVPPPGATDLERILSLLGRDPQWGAGG
ncbi:TIGR03086 family metal-binding protein [Streptomyces sp. NPDC051320]|uniref:TIGR03086 family metal-binding protein n=1 Tax=Streptomyces sp. NPDC051320 TaxID=3154644 RepID=UPI003424E1D2